MLRSLTSALALSALLPEGACLAPETGEPAPGGAADPREANTWEDRVRQLEAEQAAERKAAAADRSALAEARASLAALEAERKARATAELDAEIARLRQAAVAGGTPIQEPHLAEVRRLLAAHDPAGPLLADLLLGRALLTAAPPPRLSGLTVLPGGALRLGPATEEDAQASADKDVDARLQKLGYPPRKQAAQA